MSPEERQLITGLFDRMRPAASQQRDREAESLIVDQVRTQPYAPYLMAQTVIVQDQALRAANDKIQQLEEQVRQQQAPQPQQETSFLGGLGRSMFGQTGQSVPTTGSRGAPPPMPSEAYRQQGNPGQAPQGGGPWGQAASAAGGLFGGGAGGGGGFMKGALGAAAGVAGGVLLADGIRNLFTGGHNPYGLASGFGGEGLGGYGNQGGETIVNNYYDSPDPGQGALDYGDGQGGDGGGSDPGSYSGGYSNDV